MPAAESGKQYRTLDERCKACVMLGGEEQPCMPPHYLAREEEQTGYPCPRREWEDVDHPTIAQLVRLGANGETGHLFRAMFDVSFAEATNEERQRVLRLMFRAYQDETVRGILFPRDE